LNGLISEPLQKKIDFSPDKPAVLKVLESQGKGFDDSKKCFKIT